MRRRHFIALCGTGLTAALAGCSGESSEDDPENDTDEDSTEDGDDSGNDTDDGSEDGSENDPGDGEPLEPLTAGEPEMAVDYQQLIEDPEAGDGPVVELLIENRGDGASGSVDLSVDWLDDADGVLATAESRVETIRAGETWVARYHAESSWADDVAGFDPEKGIGDAATTPDGWVLVDGSVDTTDGNAEVSGTLRYDGDGDPAGDQVVARVFDGDDRLLADGVQDGDLAGEEVDVAVTLEPSLPDDVVDFEVLVVEAAEADSTPDDGDAEEAD